jgi:outer membrane lipoprotein LolB
MQQELGWHLPLNGLHHWLFGLAISGSEALIERDETGRIGVLRQDDWEMRYLSYANSTPESLPRHVILRHAGLEVKLLIDEWEL